jgi:SanA protein
LAEYELAEYKAKPPSRRRFPWLSTLLILIVVGVALFPVGWSKVVEWHYGATIYNPAEYQALEKPPDTAPRIALVFGARVYSRQRLSAMLRDRMDTAIDLYHGGKVDKLLLSGGQNGLEYDEPNAMVDYAINNGVPVEAIQPDYGGRRTYDTCYRAVHIFQVQKAVLVTQEFHLPRALLLCDNLGIEVVGVTADRRIYDPRSIAWSESREIPALLAALADLVRRPLPPILGEPIPLDTD